MPQTEFSAFMQGLISILIMDERLFGVWSALVSKVNFKIRQDKINFVLLSSDSVGCGAEAIISGYVAIRWNLQGYFSIRLISKDTLLSD